MFTKKFVDNIKLKFAGWFLPIVKLLDNINIHPNLLTGLSLITGLLSAHFLFYSNKLFILFICLSLFFDILDGHLARYSNKTTKFGALFDISSDRFVQIALLLKAAWFYPFSYFVIAVYFLHFLLFLFLKNNIIVYSRTAMIIFFAFGFYEIGIWYTLITSVYGIVKQIKRAYYNSIRKAI